MLRADVGRRTRSCGELLAGTSLALAGALALACSWSAWAPREKPADPDGQRRFAGELGLDEARRNEVNCSAGDCRDWYAIRVPAPGTLSADLTVIERAHPSGLRLVLHGSEHALDQTGWDDAPPLHVAGPVQPGTYFVLVEGSGGRIVYEVRASLAQAAASDAQAPATPPDASH
jgi:hypothetical protein